MGKVILHIFIDPRSTQSLLDMDFALDSWIPYCKGSKIMIGLTTELVEALVGETHGGPPLNIARVLVTMGFVSSTPIELLLCSWEATTSDDSMQLLVMYYANTIWKHPPNEC